MVVIINGRGGVGKDTICNIVENSYNTMNISAIDPVKDIARYCGWNGSKDFKSRWFLSELKGLLIEFNDLPFNHLMAEYNKFIGSSNDILFVHIREANEIEKFKKSVKDCAVVTLLVKSNTINTNNGYGNKSDDNTELYSYDYILENNGSLSDLEGSVENLLCMVFDDHQIVRSMKV